MTVDGFNQGGHMFRGRVLVNTVSQIENMGRPCLGWIGMRLAKTVQHPNHLFFDAVGGCKKHIGVDVALQGLAWTAHLAADQRTTVSLSASPTSSASITSAWQPWGGQECAADVWV